jgi:hypothetical protein
MEQREDKNVISKWFYTNLVTLLTIVGATIGGIKYAVNEGREMIRDEIKPLVERVDDLEKRYASLDDIMSMNSSGISALEVSVTHFIDNYNKTHHTTFLKPNDIELTTAPKKRKR